MLEFIKLTSQPMVKEGTVDLHKLSHQRLEKKLNCNRARQKVSPGSRKKYEGCLIEGDHQILWYSPVLGAMVFNKFKKM